MVFEGPRPEEVNALDAALAKMEQSLLERQSEFTEFPAGDDWIGRYNATNHQIELSHGSVLSKIELQEDGNHYIEIFDQNGNALLEDIHSKQFHLDHLNDLLEAELLPFQISDSKAA